MSLRSYSEIDTNLVERADRAVQASARPIIGADSSPADIRAAFKHAALIEPQPISPAIAAEVVTINDATLRRWYVGTFAPRLHEKVGRGLGDIGWDFCCPMSTEWQAVPLRLQKPGKPKKVAVKRPLFGTYGFLYPRDETKPNWMALDRVDGFGGLTRHGATKIPLRAPACDVDKFTALEAEGLFDATRSRPPKLKHLDRVLITSGHFAGLRGIVDKTAGEKARILLEMLGAVDLSVEAVEVCA